MNMFKLILIAISFVLGLLCIRHLRKYDVHEQEPFVKMFMVTVWGGAVSVFISPFLYRVLRENGGVVSNGMPLTYFYVGFIEELGKLAALFLCWPIIREELNEPTDGPIYIACVALGFSLIENYMYASVTPITSVLILIRLLICTPMHIAFSIFMGLAFFWAVRCKGGWGILLMSYIFASIYHAIYDIFVIHWLSLLLLFFIVKGGYRWMHTLLGYTAAQSPFRQTLSECLDNCAVEELADGVECIDCGNRAPKPLLSHGRIAVQRCDRCGAFLCSIKTLHNIVHQFGSRFGSLKKLTKRLSKERKHIYVLEAGNRFDRKKRIACFQLYEFNNVLEEMSRKHVERLESKWWFPFRVERNQ
jgi:RsiW-degrading membrane proteinase PrsW (M82 family)